MLEKHEKAEMGRQKGEGWTSLNKGENILWKENPERQFEMKEEQWKGLVEMQ